MLFLAAAVVINYRITTGATLLQTENHSTSKLHIITNKRRGNGEKRDSRSASIYVGVEG